ncbi:hypothetical protein JTB14_001240 [Gonioctena quinquepunctata]|nr:hypothetical protein JTB14_001240 [Gonioctena quinquepunctata]
MEWTGRANEISESNHDFLTIVEFSDWLYEIAEEVSFVSTSEADEKKKISMHHYIRRSEGESNKCKMKNHKTDKCKFFRDLDLERLEWEPKGVFSTYALFDEGSTVTLLEEEVAKKIGTNGPKDCLRWRNSITNEETGSNVQGKENYNLSNGSHRREQKFTCYIKKAGLFTETYHIADE